MAYQFVHVQTISLKSGGNIASEAQRRDGFCPHVPNPKQPILLSGVSPLRAWRDIETKTSELKNEYKKKDGSTGYRGIRKDQAIAVAAVASYPVQTSKIRSCKADFIKWRDQTLAFLEREHGPILSAVLHIDEKYPHLHTIHAAPPGQTNVQAIHPGERARAMTVELAPVVRTKKGEDVKTGATAHTRKR